MKRRSIFTGLATALAAAAQTFKGEGPEPDWRQCADPKEYPADCGKKLAKNNQCPVCGTMAPPFHPEMCAVAADASKRKVNPDGTVSGWYESVPCRMDRYVACDRCNNVFRQRAEEKH